MKKRKICFIITSFIHYSRNLLILDELKKRDDVDFHIIIGGAALLSKYSSKYADIKKMLIDDGFKNIHEVYFNLEGDETITKAKTAGMGVIEFSSIYNKIKPDLIVVRADRFEVLSAALAAAYMNIPIAHIEGGDLSGTIDESVRHAITKLSHIHFPTNEFSKKRILKMGEQKKYVLNFGSPDIDVINRLSNNDNNVDLDKTGSGAAIDIGSDYIMVMYHSVATNLNNTAKNAKILLNAIHEIDMPTFWFWPNFDAGAEKISHEIRVFKDSVHGHKIKFMRYLPPKKFLSLLKDTKCFVGNSSAGIKECSYFGVPAVNIGTRQNKRLRSDNIVDVKHNKDLIKKNINKQINVGKYPSSELYYGNNTSKKIANVLATIDLYIQKIFND